MKKINFNIFLQIIYFYAFVQFGYNQKKMFQKFHKKEKII